MWNVRTGIRVDFSQYVKVQAGTKHKLIDMYPRVTRVGSVVGAKGMKISGS